MPHLVIYENGLEDTRYEVRNRDHAREVLEQDCAQTCSAEFTQRVLDCWDEMNAEAVVMDGMTVWHFEYQPW